MIKAKEQIQAFSECKHDWRPQYEGHPPVFAGVRCSECAVLFRNKDISASFNMMLEGLTNDLNELTEEVMQHGKTEQETGAS